MRNSLGSTWRAATCLLLLASCSKRAPHADVQAPDAPVIRLSPDPAYAGARIAVVLPETGFDPSQVTYEWRRNGAIIFGAEGATLEPGEFARGDRITVRLLAPPPPAGNPIVCRADVRVVNTAPQVRSVGLELAGGAGSAGIDARVEALDADGDTPVLQYQWFRNGQPVEHAESARLSTKGLARGDRITLVVTARDEESASPAVHSDPLTMANHPPAFVSEPAAPSPGAELYVYEARADDPDGDPLRYELVNAPEGMSVTPQGEVRWILPTGEQRTGDHAVRLRAADDKGGEAVQEFTLRLGVPVASR